MSGLKPKLIILNALLFLLSSQSSAIESVPIQGQPRNQPVKRVIIHATGGPDCVASRSFKGGSLSGIVAHFRENQEKISIHYIIGRDGQVVSMVPESQVAFHARGHNSDSIGIELVNNGDGRDPFTKAQIHNLANLLAEILRRNQLGLLALQGHSEVDDDYLNCDGRRMKRKQDPGGAFPWGQLLADLRLRLQPVKTPVLVPERSRSGNATPTTRSNGSIFRR
ncbi:N-acetylmuramoyl-L-alanine amidase [Halochromatium sp.]